MKSITEILISIKESEIQGGGQEMLKCMWWGWKRDEKNSAIMIILNLKY